MRGKDVKAWRDHNGYSQAQLMQELDIRSRQTVSSWENSDKEVPRLVELALHALEHDPSVRRIAGKKATAKERRGYFTGATK